MKDLRKLCENAIWLWDGGCDLEGVIDEMRTALAHPEPVAATDEELELSPEQLSQLQSGLLHCFSKTSAGEYLRVWIRDYARAAIAADRARTRMAQPGAEGDGLFHWRNLGDGKPVQVRECPMCGIAPANVDDCGRFGDPACPYFGVGEPEPEVMSDEEICDLWTWAAGQDLGPWPTQQHCFARALIARRRPQPPTLVNPEPALPPAVDRMLDLQDRIQMGSLTPAEALVWAVNRADARPAIKPVPVSWAELTDQQVMEIAPVAIPSLTSDEADAYCAGFRRCAEAVTFTIKPVPVSERPWEREGWCDEYGMCWRFDPCDRGWWSYGPILPSDGDPAPFTYLLPHHALPLPQQPL